jgi:type I restriction enzyme R subunit
LGGGGFLLSFPYFAMLFLNQELRDVPFRTGGETTDRWAAYRLRLAGARRVRSQYPRWLRGGDPRVFTNGLDPEPRSRGVYAPFAQEGGIGKVWQVFGEDLNRILEELNETLAA